MRTTTAIALKFFAIYAIFRLVSAIPSFMTTYWQLRKHIEHPHPIGPATYLIATLCLSALALWILWRVANSLSTDKQTSSGPQHDSFDHDTLFRYALIIMGLYFALHAAIYIPGRLATYIEVYGRSGSHLYAIHFYAELVRLLLGCTLVVGAKKWSHLLTHRDKNISQPENRGDA